LYLSNSANILLIQTFFHILMWGARLWSFSYTIYFSYTLYILLELYNNTRIIMYQDGDFFSFVWLSVVTFLRRHAICFLNILSRIVIVNVCAGNPPRLASYYSSISVHYPRLTLAKCINNENNAILLNKVASLSAYYSIILKEMYNLKYYSVRMASCK